MTSDKKTYIVKLPPRHERGFSDFNKLEITMAKDEKTATRNVLFTKGKNLPEKHRVATILSLINDMYRSGQPLGKYAFEIETEFYDETKEHFLKPTDPLYRQMQESCLAEEIATKKGFPKRTGDFLEAASKWLDFYEENQRNFLNR